jgi:hypothetical protein
MTDAAEPWADFPFEDTRRPPLEGQELRIVPRIGEYGATESEIVAELDENPDIITSRMLDRDDSHRVVLDIDFPAILLPSTTPGHHHLYVDKVMTWAQYSLLLTAMAAAGLLEQGYVDACLERGFSAVRLPWVKKQEFEDRERKLRCVGCNKHPQSIAEYRRYAEEEDTTAARFVLANEGTLNRANGHFWCTACYIAVGQPLGVAP